MATRKQRRRREKSFRHEYGFVVSDEEGNEVELAGSELRARKDSPAKDKAAAKGSAKAQSSSKSSRRSSRDPEPPSWRRSLRRAGMWSPAIIAVSYLILRGLSIPIRIVFGVGYAAFFVPMTYWMDGLVYRRFVRRRDAEARPRKTR
jgi:hypothetical protein